MGTWLKLLPIELDSIKEADIIEPDVPLQKDDQHVGVMDTTTRQMFTLMRLLRKDAKQNQLDAEYCNDKAVKAEHETRYHEYAIKAELISGLMWAAIKDEFSLWHEESIGVRHGFQVVISSPEDVPPILRMLGLGGAPE